MSIPPADIPQQPWTYPPAHPPSGAAPPTVVGGYYRRGDSLIIPEASGAPKPIWHGERTGSRAKQIAAFSLAGLGVLLVVFFTMLESGLSGTVVGAIAALIPLALVLGAVQWLDRWEPEPRLYLFLAFAWGSGVATATAMYINTKAFAWLSRSVADPVAVELLGVGVVAPVTEEILKGGALLAIVLWRSRLIHSRVDLVVYAATIASGFAFTENILYFARGTTQGMFGTVFFGRAVMSPFAHIMFTTATALVIATVVFSRRGHLWWAFPVGLSTAIFLHSAWNVTATLAGANFGTVFLWLHVPIFAIFVGIIMLLRRRERRHIVTNLTQYSRAGWFAPHEVAMLGSLPQRSRARLWAGNHGVRVGQTMATFQITATRLALNRQHMIHAARKNPRALEHLVASERRYLEHVRHLRSQFHELAGPAA